MVTRQAFTKQPLHYVFIDLCPPMQSETVEFVASSLNDVLSVACSMRGSSRIPMFGLLVVKSQRAECLFALQVLKGNFVKVSTAIHEMRLLMMGNVGDSDSVQFLCAQESLQQALDMALLQFREELQKLRSINNKEITPQLQISLISQSPANELVKKIEETLKTKDLQNIRKFQILTVLSSTAKRLPDAASSSSSSMESFHNSPTIWSELVDATCLYCDAHAFDAFFKTWLHDTTTDKEHLHIRLPPGNEPGSDNKATKDMVIMCDIHEALLDPSAFIYSNRYHINTDPLVTQSLLANTTKNSSDVPIYEMDAVTLVPTGSICESILYGLPLLLRPTFCWTIEWNELEANRQRFQSFKHILIERDCVLLVRMKPLVKTVMPKDESPNGYFTIFASDAMATLLIKPIACREILMPPINVQFDGDLVSSDMKSSMESSLTSVPQIDSFNPIHMQSGLFASLKISLKNAKANTVQLKITSRQTAFEDYRKRHGNIKSISSRQNIFAPPFKGFQPASTAFPTEQ